jgi:hypothetical protein
VKIGIAYICVTKGKHSKAFAQRFIESYQRFPAGEKHELIVVFNGGHPDKELGKIFDSVPHGFHERSNLGWDIGAYQEVASRLDVDLMVCLGESIYFHRSGWLSRLCEARSRYGPGMFGSFASYLVRPHINTTGFAVSPEYLRGWPVLVRNKRDRYEFEHGENSFWGGLKAIGRPVKLVTWDGSWDWQDWRKPQNILWRGDQSNCLTFCVHCDRYYHATPKVKETWQQGADTLRV